MITCLHYTFPPPSSPPSFPSPCWPDFFLLLLPSCSPFAPLRRPKNENEFSQREITKLVPRWPNPRGWAGARTRQWHLGPPWGEFSAPKSSRKSASIWAVCLFVDSCVSFAGGEGGKEAKHLREKRGSYSLKSRPHSGPGAKMTRGTGVPS